MPTSPYGATPTCGSSGTSLGRSASSGRSTQPESRWAAPPGGAKIFEVDGEPETEQHILHIPGFGFDGTVGVSP